MSVDLACRYILFMWQIEYGFAAPGKALWGECSCSVVMKRSCNVRTYIQDKYNKGKIIIKNFILNIKK